jgi:hypothetical protein
MGKPIRSHWLNYSNITIEEAMRKIAQYSGLAVSYDRDVIRLSPKSAATEASAETREKLARLEERFQTELASMTEPRLENLENSVPPSTPEFAALAEVVKAAPNDLAAVKDERSKAAYIIRSETFRGQPGSFTQDAEGWTLFDTKGGVTQPVAHNKLGYVDGKDLIQSSDYYFSAPQSVLDLLRATTTNDSISFDFYTTASDEGIKDTLVLESPGMTLVLPASNPPIREWNRFTYRFDPSEGWKVGTIGKIGKKPAKAEEIRKAMATATKLYIRGEWKTGPDAARLDNVVITSGHRTDKPTIHGLRDGKAGNIPHLGGAIRTRRGNTGSARSQNRLQILAEDSAIQARETETASSGVLRTESCSIFPRKIRIRKCNALRSFPLMRKPEQSHGNYREENIPSGSAPNSRSSN